MSLKSRLQKRVIDTIEKSPNGMANIWEIVWNGFIKNGNQNVQVMELCLDVYYRRSKNEGKGHRNNIAAQDNMILTRFEYQRKKDRMSQKFQEFLISVETGELEQAVYQFETFLLQNTPGLSKKQARKKAIRETVEWYHYFQNDYKFFIIGDDILFNQLMRDCKYAIDAGDLGDIHLQNLPTMESFIAMDATSISMT